MNAVWPYLVFVVAAGAVVVAKRRSAVWTSSAAWLLLAGGFAFLQWSEASLSAAAGIAALAGFAALPASSADPTRRIRIAAFGATVPVTVAIATLVCVRDATPVWGTSFVLFAASWAALIAALSCGVAAIGVTKRPASMSIPAALALTAVAVWLAGSGRSSLPDAYYGFGLRTGEQPLQWVLGPAPGFDTGIRLAVAVEVPEVQAVLLALVLLGVLAAIAIHLDRRRAASTLLGLGGIAAAALLATLSSIVASLSMPGPQPYIDEVRRRLLARGGERVADTGAFTANSDISVAMADLAPEIIGLTLIVCLGIGGAIALRRDDGDDEHHQIDRLFGRDLLVRSVAFLWVTWFVLVIIHHGLIGAPGMGSPSEWVFTGVCLLATAMLFMRWSPPTSRLGEALEDLTPGLIVAMILLAAALSWRFGTLPGLSLGAFG